MRRTLPIIMLLLLVQVTAWAAYPMRVKDARGETVTIKSEPKRIVSLDTSNTEILYALGLSDRIVGVNDRSDYPAAAKKKPKVGDMTINAEAVISLRPDLVLAHAFLNDQAIPRLEKLGLTVFAVDPKTIPQAAASIRTIGRITGRPKTADKVAKSMEQQIGAIKAARAKKKPHSVLVVIQSNPLWAAGPKTFVDEMIRDINCTNVARDARPGFVPFSKELAITRSPEVIIVGLKSDADYFLKSPEWRNTSAVKNKRVYVVNNDLLVRPGPRLAQGVKELAGKVGF